MRGKLLLSLCAILLASFAMAAPELRNDHPSHYIVKPGDTLWDISATFLENPWEWPHLWRGNSHIENPHLIYPGDELVLHMYNNQPALEVNGDGTGRVVKLSPRVRAHALDDAVPPIPLSEIKPFLNESQILTQAQLENSPYIVAQAGEHMIGATGDKIYASAITSNQHKTFTIYRPDGVYQDPDTKEVLGYAGLHIGDAHLLRPGDPATLRLNAVKQEVRIGDLLCPLASGHETTNFIPKPPNVTVNGKILAVIGGVTEIGPHNVVVINRGQRNGLKQGDVLAVHRTGRRIMDPMQKNKALTLPNERSGEMMVFRTFDKVSYALVVRATHPIHIFDTVTHPQA